VPWPWQPQTVRLKSGIGPDQWHARSFVCTILNPIMDGGDTAVVVPFDDCGGRGGRTAVLVPWHCCCVQWRTKLHVPIFGRSHVLTPQHPSTPVAAPLFFSKPPPTKEATAACYSYAAPWHAPPLPAAGFVVDASRRATAAAAEAYVGGVHGVQPSGFQCSSRR